MCELMEFRHDSLGHNSIGQHHRLRNESGSRNFWNRAAGMLDQQLVPRVCSHLRAKVPL